MAASRRGLLFAIVGLLTAARFGLTGVLSAAAAEVFGPEVPVGDDHVIGLARELSKQPYVPPPVDLPAPLSDIGYDLYRSIRFDPNRMFWREEAGFAFDLLHTGFVFRIPVEIYVVSDGKQRRISYDPTLFDFSGLPAAPDPKGPGVGYSGLRLRYPLNQPGVLDEFCVFQGASYFRAIGKGQIYGLSARGLAIDTAQPKGEEFPAFRGFWIRMPQPGAMAVVVDALLDSQSVTGAYRFTVRPGETTQVDVELTLFPRTDVAHVGVAPLTSMFLFDAIDRTRFDDYRASVHDSDGLAMLTGRGEWLWRPLSNPQTLQISAFVDHGPRGFGLMQRKREFADYRDLEARYERRPAVWVEPVGDWGAGHVELVEIPSGSEVNDNIVAYWRPRDPLGAGREVRLTYRLYWGDGWPLQGPAPLARAQSSMSGGAHHRDGERRLFVIEFTGGNLDGDIKAEVSTGQGQVSNVVSQPNPETGGIRVHFELDPAGSPLAELRARLIKGSEPVSETWLYRWTT